MVTFRALDIVAFIAGDAGARMTQEYRMLPCRNHSRFRSSKRLELSSKMSGTGCRGELARDMNALSVCPTDSRAERRCALGALIAAAYQITNDFRRAHDLAISAVRPLYGSATLVNVNDVRGHAAVLTLLDEVVAVM
jgi:hypothetical protein